MKRERQTTNLFFTTLDNCDNNFDQSEVLKTSECLVYATFCKINTFSGTSEDPQDHTCA